VKKQVIVPERMIEQHMLNLDNGERASVSMMVIGGVFGVHKEPYANPRIDTTYTVTHILSGYAMFSCANVWNAIAAAGYLLGSRIDWAQTTHEGVLHLDKEERMRVREVRDAACILFGIPESINQ
jgi:hypothetical protein